MQVLDTVIYKIDYKLLENSIVGYSKIVNIKFQSRVMRYTLLVKSLVSDYSNKLDDIEYFK